MAKFPGLSLRVISSHPEMYFYFEQARRFKVMTREEECAVHRRISSGGPDGRAALEEFTNRNLRLVIAVAIRYAGLGIPTPDLMQEGNLGLLRAIKKFDSEFGFKFSTYAVWWIRQYITKALYGSGIIRVSSYMVEAKLQIPRIESHLGRVASDAELSEILGMSPLSVSRLRTLPEVTDSIHAPLGFGDDEEDFTLLDTLSDGRLYESEILDRINCSQVFRNLRDTLGSFNSRDVEILKLWASDDSTLQSVADQYDLSRERIRQVIASLIGEIRIQMGILIPPEKRLRTKRSKVSPDSDVGKGEI